MDGEENQKVNIMNSENGIRTSFRKDGHSSTSKFGVGEY